MHRGLRRLRDVIQQLPADVHVGKKGVSDGIINEIKRRLKEQGYVKVRLLKSSLQVEGKDRKELANYIAKKPGAKLIDIRGRTLVLIKNNVSYEKLWKTIESKIIKV